MEKLELIVRKTGKSELFEIREQLSNFVLDNWDILYEGAVRLGMEIEEDYYAPQRIQINHTRLHPQMGVKYASGHKYSYRDQPTEEQLKQTVADIQTLLDEASKTIECSFRLDILEKS